MFNAIQHFICFPGKLTRTHKYFSATSGRSLFTSLWFYGSSGSTSEWTVWSLCAQDKAGAVSQPSGPWGRTPEHQNTSMLPVRLSSSSRTHKTAGVISATLPCLPRLLTHQQQETVSSVMQCWTIRGALPNKPILHHQPVGEENMHASYLRSDSMTEMIINTLLPVWVSESRIQQMTKSRRNHRSRNTEQPETLQAVLTDALAKKWENLSLLFTRSYRRKWSQLWGTTETPKKTEHKAQKTTDKIIQEVKRDNPTGKHRHKRTQNKGAGMGEWKWTVNKKKNT